ncbi:MAG: hypothetical protein AAF330_04935, partial [Pseudomonadota bacterium]
LRRELSTIEDRCWDYLALRLLVTFDCKRVLIALLPSTDAAGGILTGLGFQGTDWLAPLSIPVLAAVVAFTATRLAAQRTLRQMA